MTGFNDGTIHFKNKTSTENSITGYTRLYTKTDGSLYTKDDIGTESKLMDAVSAQIYYSKFSSGTDVAITGSATATLNRFHTLSDPVSGGYTVNISGASAGDVVGFNVAKYNSAPKEYLLNVGSGVEIAGRTQYLALLHTNTAVFKYDGTKWYPLLLNLDTPWVDSGPITITATTTNPTKGTIDIDKHYWRRTGKDYHMRVQFGTSSAGTNGTGDYLIGPVLGTIDSTVTTAYTGSTVSLIRAYGLYSMINVQGTGSYGSTNNAFTVYNSTKLRSHLNNTFWGSTNIALGSSIQMHVDCLIPMTNW